MANPLLLLLFRLPSRWWWWSDTAILYMSAASVPCSYLLLCNTSSFISTSRPAAAASGLRLLVLFPFFPALLLLPRAFPSSPLLRLTHAAFSWLTLLRLLHLSFHKHQPTARPFPSFPLFAASLLCPVRLKSTTSHYYYYYSRNFFFHFRRFLFSALSLSALFALLSAFPFIFRRPIYCLITYFSLSLSHHLFSFLFLLAFRASVFPVFHRPWLASSITDFWSSRWNLTAHALLHQAIYQPLLRLLWRSHAASSSSAKPPLRARIPAVLFTFLASGLFHEIAYYGITLAESLSWEVTAFFLIHGMAVSLEICLRRKRLGRAAFRLPHALRVLLTVSFVVVTALTLFFCALETSGPFHVHCAEELRTRLSFLSAAIKDLN